MARHVLTILAVADLSRSLAFYRTAFAWPVTVETPVYAELAVPGGMRVGLYDRAGFARNVNQSPLATPSGAITASELYFHVDDLDGAITRLVGAHARVLSPRAPRPWHDEAAYFADPDGNVLVVARPIPS